MTSLTSLRNIGSQSTRCLEFVGIYSAEEFNKMGVINTYERLKSAFPNQVSLNMLYAQQGAWLDLERREIQPDLKSDLLSQVES